MKIDETNYIEIISSYSKDDWQSLLDLIPEIETSKKFEEDYKEKPNNEDGSINFPHVFGTEIVGKFQEVVYDIPIIIDFDWGSWDKGRRIVNDESFDYSSIDIPTKCKIITAIVRNDRFCEGALVSALESGLILKILKSIEKQLN